MTAPTPTALTKRLKEIRDSGQKGIIPYFTAGDPDIEMTRDILLAMTEAGVAALEIGIPFSDPIADGPVIQASSQRAIDNGATLDRILTMLDDVKEKLAPTVIFSYLNLIDRLGYEHFAKRAKDVGTSGLLVTDATPGTDPELEEALTNQGLDLIRLVAPTTPIERLPTIVDGASGFLYIIARRGVTGRGSESSEIATHIAELRKLTDVPLYVGFGVRTRADAERINAYADGVIVGSSLVEMLHELPRAQRPDAAFRYMRELQGL